MHLANPARKLFGHAVLEIAQKAQAGTVETLEFRIEPLSKAFGSERNGEVEIRAVEIGVIPEVHVRHLGEPPPMLHMASGWVIPKTFNRQTLLLK